MHKIIIISFLVLLAATIAKAQDTSTQVNHKHIPQWSEEKKAKKITAKQTRILNLNSEKEKKLKVINTDIGKKMDIVKADSSLNKKARRDKLKGLQDERNNQYKNILNASQYKTWNDEELKAKQKAKEYKERKRKKISG